ncbi:MAG: hypothetical protein J6A15_03840 [Clostridia bacterium]|nr:hypothetical protein [Clostridia bacterium]
MKKIYIIVTHTGTVLSRIIQCYTRDEYSHVSIALDENLQEMYSFGRLNPYNPFYGGFVHENINEGTFKRFKKTKACIYSLEVEEYQYRKIKKIIERFYYNQKAYKFNVIGLFAVGLHIKIKARNSFYCAEFVKYVLEKSKVTDELPKIIRPENFKYMHNLKKVYKGRLKDYNEVIASNLVYEN